MLSKRATLTFESFFETVVPTERYQYIPPPITPARETDVEKVTLVFAGDDNTVQRRNATVAINMSIFEAILKA